MPCGVAAGWEKFTGDAGRSISVEHCGASVSYERLYREFGITAEAVAAAARDSLYDVEDSARPGGHPAGFAPPPTAPPTGPPMTKRPICHPIWRYLGPRKWDRWRRWTLAAATAAWAARMERQMIGRLRHSDEEDSRYTESLDGDSTAMVIATVFLTQGLAQLLCPPRSSSPRPAHCPAPPGDGFPSGHRRHAHRSCR
jgi:hypothetical protein